MLKELAPLPIVAHVMKVMKGLNVRMVSKLSGGLELDKLHYVNKLVYDIYLLSK